ncbi:MAG: putative toxin-antitoxin system toxin component, PIN family [Acidobacteria bacterium]|nr:putative toxin-antitoxin system toxin component, PIN family [Acidobacteriota bacterium]
MIIKAVLDTNVVVSANLVDDGLPAAILDLAINKNILMVVSPAVLEEYKEVLYRPRFKLDPARVAAVMALIRKNALLVRPTAAATAAKGDESDNRFLECADAGGADYIVTGNTKHFPETYEQARVVTPRQFIDLILPSLAQQTR